MSGYIMLERAKFAVQRIKMVNICGACMGVEFDHEYSRIARQKFQPPKLHHNYLKKMISGM